MQHFIGYVRVSTQEQAEGISLDNQKAKIQAYCNLNDLTLVDVVTDEGISAKNMNRPGLIRVLEMARRKEIDGIVIYKLDRMFRNTVDALTTAKDFDKRGIALHSINEKLDTQSAMGRFFFTLMAGLAEMERNLISERTTDALANKRADGYRTGEIPLGFDLIENDKLIVNEDEMNIVRYIHEMKSQGISNRNIADLLTAEGIKTKKGNAKWCYQTIRNIANRAVAV